MVNPKLPRFRRAGGCGASAIWIWQGRLCYFVCSSSFFRSISTFGNQRSFSASCPSLIPMALPHVRFARYLSGLTRDGLEPVVAAKQQPAVITGSEIAPTMRRFTGFLRGKRPIWKPFCGLPRCFYNERSRINHRTGGIIILFTRSRLFSSRQSEGRNVRNLVGSRKRQG